MTSVARLAEPSSPVRDTTLRGGRLALARGAVAALSLVTALVFVRAVPATYAFYAAPCAPESSWPRARSTRSRIPSARWRVRARPPRALARSSGPA